MFLDRSHVSFANNIYIDHPKNKARLKFDCIIFCFQKITSFHIPHINLKTSTLPSKLQREKMSSCFLTYFPAFLLWETDAATYQRFLTSNKIYRTFADKLPLYQIELASKLFLSPFGFCSIEKCKNISENCTKIHVNQVVITFKQLSHLKHALFWMCNTHIQ